MQQNVVFPRRKFQNSLGGGGKGEKEKCEGEGRKKCKQHYVIIRNTALSRISPRVRVRVSISIVLGLASGGYSCIRPVTLPAVSMLIGIFHIGKFCFLGSIF